MALGWGTAGVSGGFVKPESGSLCLALPQQTHGALLTSGRQRENTCRSLGYQEPLSTVAATGTFVVIRVTVANLPCLAMMQTELALVLEMALE